MEFTKTDVIVIISMSILLIVINFTFPALGLTPTETSQADIPSFNLTEGTINFVQIGEPLDISRPTEGTLRYVDNQVVYEDNRRVWLEGNSNDGFEITLTNNGTTADPAASLFLNEYNNSGFVKADSTEMQEETPYDSLELEGYVISFENVSFTKVGQANMTITVDWEIEETPGGASFASGIPLIGGGLEAIAKVVAGIGSVFSWIGSIILGIFFNIGATARNAAVIVFNIFSFFLGIGHWFIVTYASVVSNAPASWIQLILSIPAFLISLEFAKLAIIGKELIPIL